jgi:K+-sensing histidine kinase KdpD
MKPIEPSVGAPLVLPAAAPQAASCSRAQAALVRLSSRTPPGPTRRADQASPAASSARSLEATAAAAVLVGIVTIIMHYVEIEFGPAHLILGYLVPTCLIAFRYGSRPATLTAIAGTFAAAFFLYAPIFSFYVAKPLDIAELGLVLVLAIATTQFIGAISEEPTETLSR